eukprot:COSAG04_NODE_25693_length_304_cov_0.980488_1_plen_80_part_10
MVAFHTHTQSLRVCSTPACRRLLRPLKSLLKSLLKGGGHSLRALPNGGCPPVVTGSFESSFVGAQTFFTHEGSLTRSVAC